MLDTARLRLYLVADPDLVDGELVHVVAAAIRGGVTCVQLRVKGHPDREYEELAGRVGRICRDASILFLVNDRVDIAVAAGADGVHLGVDDLSIVATRALAGPDFVIGFSPDTDDQATESRASGADYLGVGPIFHSHSKPNAGAPIGTDRLRRRMRLSGLPTVGIGGITMTNAGEVIAAGATGIAVMSAILRSSDPAEAARQLEVEIGRRRR